MKDHVIDFKAICDQMPSTIYVTDTDERTIYVNQAYLDYSGLKREEVIGRTIDEIRKADVFYCDIQEKVLKSGKQEDAIGYIPSAKLDVYVTGVPVRDEEGTIQYVLSTDGILNSLEEVKEQLMYLQTMRRADSQELEYYRNENTDHDMVFCSQEMQEVMLNVQVIAPTDVTVLLTGESGTGKEMVANAIYAYGSRKDKPYIKVNCAAIPSDLLESELFGYAEGAFTGAKKGGKPGAFELADGGTLFLDEIGEIPYQVQAKLLRALQEQEIQRVGAEKTKKLDIRVIAATNRDLLEEVKAGKFREDLYYRLNVLPIELPPLRERREDIPALINKFLEFFSEKYKKPAALESGAMKLFAQYDWPGNVRELKNLMERLVVINRSGIIEKSIIERNLDITEETQEYGSLKEAVIETEKRVIKQSIEKHGSKRKAAQALGVDHSTIVKKCKQYGID